MRFEKVIIIGSGKIACDCVEILKSKSIALEVIESKYSTVSMLQRTCIRNAVQYCMLKVKELLETELSKKLAEEQAVLVVSANNEFIFPKAITDLPHVTIINFHYAYLPDYRGMNIPTWVIYNEEPYTGVTWHYVNASIDAGEIIIQKKIPLKGNETAFEIVRRGMALGRITFNEMIDALLEEDVIGGKNQNGKHYYTRKQLPDNGILNAHCSADYAKKLLRAFDYKGINIFPKLKIRLPDSTIYSIERYRVWQDDSPIVKGSGWRANYKICGKDMEIDLLLKK